MKRSELEKFLGKTVEILLFDGDSYGGELHKTNEERFKSNAELYLKPNFYFIINPNPNLSFYNSCVSGLFRSTHVSKILCIK